MSMDKFILRNIVGYYQKGCSTDNFLSLISSSYLEGLEHVISWFGGASSD